MNIPNWEWVVTIETVEVVETPDTETVEEEKVEEIVKTAWEEIQEQVEEKIQEKVEVIEQEAKEELDETLSELISNDDVAQRQNKIQECITIITRLKIEKLEVEEENTILKERNKEYIRNDSRLRESMVEVMPEHRPYLNSLYKQYGTPTESNKTKFVRETAALLSEMCDDFDPSMFYKAFADEKVIQKQYEVPEAWIAITEQDNKPKTYSELRESILKRQRSYIEN